MSRRGAGSLRRRLLVRLSVPLCLVLMLGAVVTFALAHHFGNLVHDRWLYDSAMTLAAQLKSKNGQTTLSLPGPAIEMFEWDSVDRISEEVTSRNRGHIFSNATFPSPPAEMVPGKPSYYDGLINGQPVRIVAVTLPNPTEATESITIQVAETRHKREALVTEILLLSVPIEAGILGLAGTFIWLAVTSSLGALDAIATRLAEYEPDGLLPVSDIENAPSEVQPLVNSINRLIAKLSDAQETQRRFVANAAHQLRTPLSALQVQTERALREPDPVAHEDALSHVLRAVTRLRHVTHQLLTLTRSDRSAERALNMVQVDLAALARDELERWADVAIARSIDLGYEGPENSLDIRGDPHLLRELIGNLVDNAIRYGHSGGEVTLGLRQLPTTLYVDDDGPGIPPEDRALVLERFYRRPSTGGDGCGLGLAIAREIAARHGAGLHIVDNPLSGGTRVEVVFSDRTYAMA